MKKILIIDDEPDIAELLKLFCESLQYEADSYGAPADGLAAARNGAYWAVLCDFLMPGLTGEAVYRKIKELNCGLAARFVLMSGALADERIERLERGEGVRVLQKPFTFNEIKAVLHTFEGL